MLPRLDAGRPWLRGRSKGRGLSAGVTIIEEGQMAGQKAPDDGVYELGKGRFRVKKGDVIPEGGVFVKAGEATARRAPKETTKAAGPAETAAKDAARD